MIEFETCVAVSEDMLRLSPVFASQYPSYSFLISTRWFSSACHSLNQTPDRCGRVNALALSVRHFSAVRPLARIFS
jgi:hypothetical protein